MKASKEFQPDRIAGKETMAYTFEGVYFDKEKSELAVTDGKMIIIQKLTEDETEGMECSGIIPLEIFKQSRSGLRKAEKRTITTKDNTVSINYVDGSVRTQNMIEGRFPEYRNYLPKQENSFKIALSIKALYDLAKAYNAKDDMVVTLSFGLSEKNEFQYRDAIVIHDIADSSFKEGENTAVIMPRKAETKRVKLIEMTQEEIDNDIDTVNKEK